MSYKKTPRAFDRTDHASCQCLKLEKEEMINFLVPKAAAV